MLQKTLGLTDFAGNIRDGVISCSFTRQSDMNTTHFWNLDHTMYLLVGTGPMEGGKYFQSNCINVQLDILGKTGHRNILITTVD